MRKCNKCNDKGWYFVDEWFGNLQGRKDYLPTKLCTKSYRSNRPGAKITGNRIKLKGE